MGSSAPSEDDPANTSKRLDEELDRLQKEHFRLMEGLPADAEVTLPIFDDSGHKKRVAEFHAKNPHLSYHEAEKLSVDLLVRNTEKIGLLLRGHSNRLAERALDRQGRPRPPGWHSVFFYPDSNMLRYRYVALVGLAVVLGWSLTDG